MKKFISKIQDLSQRATELQAAIKSAPPKFAELRETVALTTGQLQQLRSDVEQGITDLRADNDVQLIDSLREINSSTQVFHQAGYDLSGVDVELSPVQRIIVQLHRMQDVSASTLQSLLSENQNRKLTHALLKSLVQAEDMAEQVDLTNLVYYKLIVNVGPVPAVRLCWRSEDEEFVVGQLTAGQPAASPTRAAERGLESYGKDSFFGRKPGTGPEPTPAERPEPPTAEPVVTKASAPAASATDARPSAENDPQLSLSGSGRKDWGKTSLERFKTMPHVSKVQAALRRRLNRWLTGWSGLASSSAPRVSPAGD